MVVGRYRIGVYIALLIGMAMGDLFAHWWYGSQGVCVAKPYLDTIDTAVYGSGFYLWRFFYRHYIYAAYAYRYIGCCRGVFYRYIAVSWRQWRRVVSFQQQYYMGRISRLSFCAGCDIGSDMAWQGHPNQLFMKEAMQQYVIIKIAGMDCRNYEISGVIRNQTG